MDKNTTNRRCLNCDAQLPPKEDNRNEVYCSQCGQSSKESRLSFGRLLNDAISNVLNLDSRLIHTFRDIFYPSKLTRYYIEGRRKYYVNPARLFIFMLIALITLALYSFKIENSAMGVDRIYTKAERSKLLDEFEALIDTTDVTGHEDIVDTIKTKLFNKVGSIKNDTLGKNGPTLFNSANQVKDFGISTYDGIHLTQKQLFEKYKVEKFWDKINVGQYIRIVTNPAGGIKHVIKNLTWAVFFTVLLMSFLMKLIYIRSPFFLVEHVVLILNSHSLMFLLAIFNIAMLAFVPLGEARKAVNIAVPCTSFALIMIVQFLSLKRYYKQGIIKTFLKQLLLNLAYVFIFNMVVAIVAIISLILY